jgi:hypothetical protein
MQDDDENRKTGPALPGRWDERIAPRQGAPWALLHELTAAIQDFNVTHPQDESTSTVARPIAPK